MTKPSNICAYESHSYLNHHRDLKYNVGELLLENMYVFLWVVNSRIQVDYLKQEWNWLTGCSHQRNKLDTKELSCKGLIAGHLWGSGQQEAVGSISVFRKHVESVGQHATSHCPGRGHLTGLVTSLRDQDLHQQSLDCPQVNKVSFLKGKPEWPVRREETQ